MNQLSASRLLSLFIVMILFAAPGPTAVHSSTPTETTPDEIDDVTRSAKTAVEIINQNLSGKSRELASVSNKLQGLLDDAQVQNELITRQIKAKLDRMKTLLDELRKLLAAVREDVSQVAAILKELKAQKEALTEQIAAKEKALAGLETAAAEAANAAAEAAEAAKAQPVLIAISRDRLKAAKLIEFIRNNNRVPLSEMLKRETPGSDVDVREVKDTNGLLALFRIGGLTHCLSTKNQCGGKPYSATK